MFMHVASTLMAGHAVYLQSGPQIFATLAVRQPEEIKQLHA
jgi:hypothetical protein